MILALDINIQTYLLTNNDCPQEITRKEKLLLTLDRRVLRSGSNDRLTAPPRPAGFPLLLVVTPPVCIQILNYQ